MSSNGLSVLFVGGTGTISASSVRRAVESGMEVSVLNRGQSALRSLPNEVRALVADIRDPSATTEALGNRSFDAVVNFLDYTGEQAGASIETFTGRTPQYVHISSVAVYQKPVLRLPYRESSPRRNPYLTYARNKIAAEDALFAAYQRDGFPVTVVRPAHTYDEATPPVPGGWTTIDRIGRGAEVVVHGDGTSLWTLTHARDFAIGLVGLLGNPQSIGEAFHITSDFVYTWNQIYETIASAAGAKAKLLHLPSELLPIAAPDWPWTALFVGDLQWSVLFDNAKIRDYVPEFEARVPFHDGVEEMLAWRSDHADETRSDANLERIFDRLVDGYHETSRLLASRVPAEDAAGAGGS